MNWLDRLVHRAIHRVADSRKYDLTVGPESDPVYYRWHVWPRNRFFNCYLHHFVKDDDDRALHTHRMMNVSILLVGAYDEVLFNRKPKEGWFLPLTYSKRRKNHHWYFRLPSTPHRIMMIRNADGTLQDVWSLFIGGPHVVNWFFWCPFGRRVPWQEYSKPGAYGEIGKGCGE